MRRGLIAWLIVGAALAMLVAWLASRTYWSMDEVPGQRHGEALFNEDYAATRFAGLLGARAVVVGPLEPLPPSGGVLVLADWNWHLYAGRAAAIRRWVEAGGRLVIDRTLDGGQDFDAWSGISGERLPGGEAGQDARGAAREAVKPDSRPQDADPPAAREAPRESAGDDDACLDLNLASGEIPSDPTATLWLLCQAPGNFRWRASRLEQLALDHGRKHELLRVGVGHGSVTAVNAFGAFDTGSFLRGDHPRLFVIATQLRRGDVLQFVRGGQALSLPGWLWSLAAPLLVLLAAALLLALWRMLVPFGPPLQPPAAARRSLRAQVAGTAAFLARNGGAHALWAASCQALAEAASGHLASPPGDDRARLAAGLARLGIGPGDAIKAALMNPALDSPDLLVRTLATLERARRDLPAIVHPAPGEGTAR